MQLMQSMQEEKLKKSVLSTKNITAYSFPDMLRELQPYLKEGYEIDFETNEGYPQHIGIVFTATVNSVVKVKVKEQDAVQKDEPVIDAVATEETKKETTKATRRSKLNAS